MPAPAADRAVPRRASWSTPFSTCCVAAKPGGYCRMIFHLGRPSALEIIKRPRALPRSEPLPRRWVVELSFAGLIKNRRLIRDFEQRTDVAETLIRIAATATMIRRIA